MQLDLSHRVAQQLAAPAIQAPHRDVAPGKGKGIEMLRLAEIRNLAEELPTEETPDDEKRRITVDKDVVDHILGRNFIE
jgi:hypothetical protein